MVGHRNPSIGDEVVSMKSGLEGRNNPEGCASCHAPTSCLNEVRPRRPEQLADAPDSKSGPESQ